MTAPHGRGGELERAPRRGRTAVRWAGLALLAGLAALALRHLDLAALGRALAQARPGWLAAAVGVRLAALVLHAGRWLALVRPAEPRARARDALLALVAGHAVGLVAPARASDLARAHLLARRAGASTAALAATAVVDLLVGGVGLLAGLGLVAALAAPPPWARAAGVAALAAACAGLGALWLVRPRPGRPAELAGGLAGVLGRLRQGLAAVGRPRALAASAAFALGGWAGEVLVADLCLRAFGLDAGPVPAALVVLAATLSAASSISPGNAGTLELACVVALSGLGVPREPALAFALGYHAVHAAPAAVIGGGWLVARRRDPGPAGGGPS